MVLEDTLNKAVKRKIYAVVLGALYVFVGYGTAQLFFPNDVSTAIIMLTTLLFVPTTSRLMGMEERIERSSGRKRFFRNHATLMEVFLFLFIGISLGYLVIGSVAPVSLSYQNSILSSQGALQLESDVPKMAQLSSISLNNIEVIVIAFVLSLFYGAGALFLIVRTASVFAAFVIQFTALIGNQTLGSSMLFLHFVPEIFGFLLAAAAGGIVSKAIMRERIGTSAFRNVLQDSTVLLGLSIAFILAAALIEVFVTPALVHLFV